MQPKVLFVSHTTNFIKFNLPYMKWFRDQGWLVHYASAEEEPFPDDVCDAHFRISFQRSPYSTDNIVAYKQIKELIDNQNYQIIHCHTPVGGAVTRLAARDARKRGTKVIYTAHGFHFYRGAPKRNWMLYYPVEKYLSRYTDCLVTINSEDYRLAAEKFNAIQIRKISGVGVNLETFYPVSEAERIHLKKQFGFSEDDFLLIYAGELNQNKNQSLLLYMMKDIRHKLSNIKLLLAGKGDLESHYKAMTKSLGLEDAVYFLGYCSNMTPIYQMSDLGVSSSIREGLPLNLLESMACGLPIVASKNRGHCEIVSEDRNGLLFSPYDSLQLLQKIEMLYSNQLLRQQMSVNNLEDVKKYSLENSLMNMQEIYESVNDKISLLIKE